MCNTSCELYLPCISSASTVQHKKYCMQLVNLCLSYQICNCMPSFELQFLTSVVYACACAAVRVAAYMCMCVYIYIYIYMCVYIYIAYACVHACICCTSLSDHHTLYEETKLNFIILFTYCSNLQISCMCVKKKYKL